MKRTLSFAAVSCLLAVGGCGGGGGGSDPGVAGTKSAVVFNEDELNDFVLTLAPADWDAIVNQPMDSTYYHGTLQWKTDTLTDIGVRVTGGESTRIVGNLKPSLRLKFNEFVAGQKLHGLKTLKLTGLLNDPYMMKDRIAYGVFRGRMAASRCVHCRVIVNGTLLGLYEVEERVDEEFVQHHVPPGPSIGNLYRIRPRYVDAYAWFGNNPPFYVPGIWEPRTNELVQDPALVLNYVDVLNHNPAAFGSICDLDALLEYFAVEAVIADSDALASDFGMGDHYQYYQFETGRFRIIPWDPSDSQDEQYFSRDIFINYERSVITALIMNTPELAAQYKEKILAVMAANPLSAINGRIDFIYTQIADEAHADRRKPWTNEQFDDGPRALKTFWQTRYANLASQLAAP